MEEHFSLATLFINEKPCSWQEAVTISGQRLLALEAIEEAYIDAMIAAVDKLGPYMVIAPHLAIAHAAPSEHVYRNELVLGVFKEPVIFGCENDPVHIVIALCAVSPHSHLKQFQKIATMFEDEDSWQKLFLCDTVEQLYEVVNSY